MACVQQGLPTRRSARACIVYAAALKARMSASSDSER